MSSKRHRAYACTYNNYPADWQDRYNQLWDTGKFKYIIGGREVGDSGTPHIQTHFNLKNGMTIKALQKALIKCGIKASVLAYSSKAHEDNGCNYPEKDDDYETWGTKPQPGKRNDLERCMADIAENKDITRLELFESHPSVMARYGRFADEYKSMKHKPKRLNFDDETTPNLWLHGQPGVGKTKQIWDLEEEGNFTLYVKNCNKWWCGFNDEHTTLIDDVSPEQAKFLGYHLKIWVQQNPFRAEIKGSSAMIRPKRIIITSNYSIDEMGWDPVTTSAIQRRFKEIEVTKFSPYPLPEVRLPILSLTSG